MGERQLDALAIAHIVGASAFVFLYLRHSMWAWYLAIVLGPMFLMLPCFLAALGWLSPPSWPAPATVQVIVTVLQFAFLIGVAIWLFRVRERYFRYIADAQSAKA